MPPRKIYLTNFTLQSSLLSKKALTPVTATQIRLVHTDFKIPDYTDYRRNSVKDPSASNRDTYENRNAFTYMVL
ncbi:hypothetical protein INO76_15405, partial [Staphylococcus aureus]|nr:hypothetical protein [Staphylococcus aureus]